jgi:hypothetical protein
MKFMKTLFILALLLIAASYKSLAQTNDISPELHEATKGADARLQFYLTNEFPIHTEIIVRNGETKCQVSYRGHTNVVVYVPIPEQEFDAHLFSASGKEISKATGCKFGQKLQPDRSLLAGTLSYFDGWRGYDRRLDFKNGNCSHFWGFDILKSFRIKEADQYRLQVEVRLFTKDTNGLFQPFILPPVEAKVNISASDLGKLNSTRQP